MLTSFRNAPSWNDLELESRATIDALELCLTVRGKPVAFSHARHHRDRGFRWLHPPVGLEWAVDLLREATDEWLRAGSTGNVRVLRNPSDRSGSSEGDSREAVVDRSLSGIG